MHTRSGLSLHYFHSAFSVLESVEEREMRREGRVYEKLREAYRGNVRKKSPRKQTNNTTAVTDTTIPIVTVSPPQTLFTFSQKVERTLEQLASAPQTPGTRSSHALDDSALITLAWVTSAIEHFQVGGLLPKASVMQLIRRSILILKSQENYVNIPIHPGSTLTIVGDLHGQLQDLLTIFNLNGFPSPQNCYLFNGDFVDRGKNSVEVVLVLLSFFVLYPQAMHLNRGNHETNYMNRVDGFEKECLLKYDREVQFNAQYSHNLFALAPLKTLEIFSLVRCTWHSTRCSPACRC
jgi:hypothetical protein